MASLDLPKLRPLTPHLYHHEGQQLVALVDPSGVVAEPISLS